MFRSLALSLIVALATVNLTLTPAYAAAPARQQTVTLDVDNMTCSLCPFTVRKALQQVPGVIKAEAKYEGHGVGWARVTFDPGKVGIRALTLATTQAGYPSRLKQ